MGFFLFLIYIYVYNKFLYVKRNIIFRGMEEESIIKRRTSVKHTKMMNITTKVTFHPWEIFSGLSLDNRLAAHGRVDSHLGTEP